MTFFSWPQLLGVISLTAALPFVGGAQTPDALMQYSTLTGSGNTITATWIPVTTSSGTVYKNITLVFDVDSKGDLTIASGYPHVTLAPATIVSSFQSGNYVGPSTIWSGEMSISVTGGGIAPGGATEWTLAASKGAAPETFPSSATWYVGPLSTNPLEARITAAGLTSTYPSMSFGVGSSSCWSSNCNYAWNQNVLFGVSQAGNSLTFYSFTDSGNKDHDVPQNQITYTLAP